MGAGLALDTLREPWRALEQGARLPTQSYAWVRACAEAFGGHAVVAVDGAVAPLVRRGRRLELLGVEEISEPSDLLARDEAALASLLEAIQASGRPLHLKRIPADSPTVTAFERAGRGHVRIRPEEGSPFIRLDDGWQDPPAKLSSRRRADLKRAVKRAEKDGPIRYELHAPGPEEAEALLDVAWDVESRSWRTERNGTLVQDTLRGGFFRAWARYAAQDGTLRIALMVVGDTPIAMQLATVFADGYWLLKVGYDAAYSRGSPGMLLMAETIRLAAEAHLSTFELMGVVEPWTHVWTEDVRESVAIHTYPLTFGGATSWMSDAARAVRARLERSAE